MALRRFLEGLSEYISGLDVEKQERIARSLVRRAINEDIDQTTTYDIFSRQGFKIERSRFSDIYTTTQQIELNSQRVKYLHRMDTPKDENLYPSFTLQDARYNFGVQYEIYDETDEQWHKKFFFLETNKLATRGQIESMVENIVLGLYGKEDGDFRNFSLRYGEINVKAIR